jgi:hypothetical protein
MQETQEWTCYSPVCLLNPTGCPTSTYCPHRLTLVQQSLSTQHHIFHMGKMCTYLSHEWNRNNTAVAFLWVASIAFIIASPLIKQVRKVSAPTRFIPIQDSYQSPPECKSETLKLQTTCSDGHNNNFHLLLDGCSLIFMVYVPMVSVAQSI